ncbi:hypothetical protein N7527_004137 [Penicillium freii]|uniref:NADH dehydrogenase [ubiquinone] 1 alpha subcomplex subunit 13 n=1 Tax=Penicillium freii TaxID=48697 RepID=A0A101MKS9_PENFR|nr:hypothetical protein N7465_001021 [Penicillium sp. CMV-2018d]KAJ5530744.1 hypothetical protein N7527_004137 [Penicillium freii]KAJ5967729.1 hypothetical protein N7501_003977 [Penicillium viridicatum]KUM62329.1 hypothetical protein ACN42_g4789 [Penicillium freii]
MIPNFSNRHSGSSLSLQALYPLITVTMPQDMPPTGGYAQVQYKRNVPARGFKPAYYMIGMHVIMAYGFYKYFHGVREQRELAREKIWSRLHLTPLLQAEEDRDQVRRHYADKAREKELLGTDAKVYNSDRFIRPTFAYTPANLTQ